MSKHRTTENNIGFVYLFTNDCYEKENTYKYGISINPFERNGIQKNSTPPTHPFYYRLLVLSPDYIEIENWLEGQFKEHSILLYGNGGGTEWVRAPFNEIIDIFKDALKAFPNPKTKMCYNGKSYQYIKEQIVSKKLPKCQLDLLGITNGEKIKCIKNNKYYVVQDNKILVDGCTEPVPLSTFISQNFARNTGTNEHSGYQFFTYKNVKIFDLWQRLVNIKNGD